MKHYAITCNFYSDASMICYIKAKNREEAKEIVIKLLIHKNKFYDLYSMDVVELDDESIYITKEMMDKRVDDDTYALYIDKRKGFIFDL